MSLKTNRDQKDSASWLHLAIEAVIKENHISVKDLQAIAVSAGPGSYTGLRVGMAAAKGLCFALDIPLIFVNTLQQMAASAKHLQTELLCPMIDARRMEVFTAMFDNELRERVPTSNKILDEGSFAELLSKHTISFFGNGSTKFQPLVHHANAFFVPLESDASHMISLSHSRYLCQDFADLAYSEPIYGKDFYAPKP